MRAGVQKSLTFSTNFSNKMKAQTKQDKQELMPEDHAYNIDFIKYYK
jgi:hypothetical protein